MIRVLWCLFRSRFLNTGIEHWNKITTQFIIKKKKLHTCSKFSKSLAASLFIADVLELNRQIVEAPKHFTYRGNVSKVMHSKL